MIDLTKLPPDDAERIAYAEGFTGVGALFARIGDLEHAIYVLLNELEVGKVKLPDELNDAVNDLRELLP